MNPLTDAQRQVYNFVKTYAKANKMPPTRKEIAAEFGWSSWNSAQCHLEAIAKKGYIRILDGKVSRGIVVLK